MRLKVEARIRARGQFWINGNAEELVQTMLQHVLRTRERDLQNLARVHSMAGRAVADHVWLVRFGRSSE
jgi:hypothetical protein